MAGFSQSMDGLTDLHMIDALNSCIGSTIAPLIRETLPAHFHMLNSPSLTYRLCKENGFCCSSSCLIHGVSGIIQCQLNGNEILSDLISFSDIHDLMQISHKLRIVEHKTPLNIESTMLECLSGALTSPHPDIYSSGLCKIDLNQNIFLFKPFKDVHPTYALLLTVPLSLFSMTSMPAKLGLPSEDLSLEDFNESEITDIILENEIDDESFSSFKIPRVQTIIGASAGYNLRLEYFKSLLRFDKCKEIPPENPSGQETNSFSASTQFLCSAQPFALSASPTSPSYSYVEKEYADKFLFTFRVSVTPIKSPFDSKRPNPSRLPRLLLSRLSTNRRMIHPFRLTVSLSSLASLPPNAPPFLTNANFIACSLLISPQFSLPSLLSPIPVGCSSIPTSHPLAFESFLRPGFCDLANFKFIVGGKLHDAGLTLTLSPALASKNNNSANDHKIEVIPSSALPLLSAPFAPLSLPLRRISSLSSWTPSCISSKDAKLLVTHKLVDESSRSHFENSDSSIKSFAECVSSSPTSFTLVNQWFSLTSDQPLLTSMASYYQSPALQFSQFNLRTRDSCANFQVFPCPPQETSCLELGWCSRTVLGGATTAIDPSKFLRRQVENANKDGLQVQTDEHAEWEKFILGDSSTANSPLWVFQPLKSSDWQILMRETPELDPTPSKPQEGKSIHGDGGNSNGALPSYMPEYFIAPLQSLKSLPSLLLPLLPFPPGTTLPPLQKAINQLHESFPALSSLLPFLSLASFSSSPSPVSSTSIVSLYVTLRPSHRSINPQTLDPSTFHQHLPVYLIPTSSFNLEVRIHLSSNSLPVSISIHPNSGHFGTNPVACANVDLSLPACLALTIGVSMSPFFAPPASPPNNPFSAKRCCVSLLASPSIFSYYVSWSIYSIEFIPLNVHVPSSEIVPSAHLRDCSQRYTLVASYYALPLHSAMEIDGEINTPKHQIMNGLSLNMGRMIFWDYMNDFREDLARSRFSKIDERCLIEEKSKWRANWTPTPRHILAHRREKESEANLVLNWKMRKSLLCIIWISVLCGITVLILFFVPLIHNFLVYRETRSKSWFIELLKKIWRKIPFVSPAIKNVDDEVPDIMWNKGKTRKLSSVHAPTMEDFDDDKFNPQLHFNL